MLVRKARADGQIVDVISFEEFRKDPSKYPVGLTAVEEEGIVYPVRGKNDNRPGVYCFGNVMIDFVPPPENMMNEYSSENIIDFSNASSLKEVIEKQNAFKSMERVILSNPDNIFKPAVMPSDAPEMVALKEAVTKKNIDLDKYESRFGPNYNNDRRLFNRPSITLSKLKTLANALDLKVTLTIEDKSADVPNPMNDKISVEITSSYDPEEEATD